MEKQFTKENQFTSEKQFEKVANHPLEEVRAMTQKYLDDEHPLPGKATTFMVPVKELMEDFAQFFPHVSHMGIMLAKNGYENTLVLFPAAFSGDDENDFINYTNLALTYPYFAGRQTWTRLGTSYGPAGSPLQVRKRFFPDQP